MRKIDYDVACDILAQAGVPKELWWPIDLSYRDFITENMVRYIVTLWTHSMGTEQIMTVLQNSIGTADIFNVPRFFREITPNAQKLGFSKAQIENDINEFENDMQKYACELIGRREVKTILQNPVFATEDMDDVLNLCTAGNNKYYRAGIEFVEWCKLVYVPNERIREVLNRCVMSNGIDIKRLLRLTTGNPGFGGNSVVSHAGSWTVKPKIRMQNLKYAHEVHRFFADNADKIRKIVQTYNVSDVRFMREFGDLCTGWLGWSWSVAPVVIDGSKQTLLGAVGTVMYQLTDGLPQDLRAMIKNIAEHEFSNIVPGVQYEHSTDWAIRVLLNGHSA